MMQGFDAGSFADAAGAFNAKRGRAADVSALHRAVRRAVAAVRAPAASSRFASLRGAALFHSFAPAPDVSALPSAYMVRIGNDNAAAPATRFLDSAHKPLPPRPVVAAATAAFAAPAKRGTLRLGKPAADVPAVAREFAVEAAAVLAPVKAPRVKLTLNSPVKVDMASAIGLTRSSSASDFAAVFRAQMKMAEKQGTVSDVVPVKNGKSSTHEAKWQELLTAFKAAGTEMVAAPLPVSAPATAPRHAFNLTSAGVPSILHKIHKSPTPAPRKAPGLSVAA